MPELLTLLPDDPRTVGPYRLEGRLGAGGQGAVYAGRGPEGVRVAVKLLHPYLIADDEARVRFLREVETAKRVAPFCTAQMLDSGFAGSRPYIVSEFVDGPSLQESVRANGPRGAAALQRLAINTATALAAIHAAGVVHRDFKPGNVLLGPDGPVVIDFGIAKALDLSQSVVTSQPIGSPAYMAPEQIAGGDVGPPADLFTWAATMHYAATGRRAFGGDTIPATLHAVLSSEPDLGGLEERFRRLLRECLAKDPARRPTAAQVVERLRALPAPSWQRTPPGKPGRRRTVVAVSIAAALGTAAGVGFYALAPATAQQQKVAAPTASATVTSGTPAPQPATHPPSITAMQGEVNDLAKSATATPPRAPRRSSTPRPSDPDPDPPRSRKPSSAPKTSKSTPRTTHQSAAPKTPSSQESTKPPGPAPSTGQVTWNDAAAYCKAQGYTGVSYMVGWQSMKCQGSDHAVTTTKLCAWKYPDYPRAEGEEPANPYTPMSKCRLS
ncbi:serine/threonine protein kinase [Nonomuraea sp. SBT364]|uniref:serine/threonine protein kinase n=1 Tax=Nonomuraea sp. SBT364 TaxID=1580530 RepID=UPI00069D08B1|nr:serine/threonine-protein kinase [Nonomuraea sp. SBT364]